MAEIIQFPGNPRSSKEDSQKNLYAEIYKAEMSKISPLNTQEVMAVGKYYTKFITQLTQLAVSEKFKYRIDNPDEIKSLEMYSSGYTSKILFSIPNTALPLSIDERKLSIKYYAEIILFRSSTGKLDIYENDINNILHTNTLELPLTAVWHYIGKPNFEHGEDLKETIFNILGY